MSGLLRTFTRSLAMLAAVAVVLLAIDTGSVVLAKVSSPDDVKQAGYAAASIAKHGPNTRQTAVSAYQAAQQSASPHKITVQSKGFTIYPDGRVTLTGTRVAPTFVLGHVSFLRHFAQVHTTMSVAPRPYDD